MLVHIGVLQGSKMSPLSTEQVKRICYADDIIVLASGVKILELYLRINGYLTEMSCFLQDNLLLISAPRSTVTLFTQTQYRPTPTEQLRSLTQSFPLFITKSYIYIYDIFIYIYILSVYGPFFDKVGLPLHNILSSSCH